MSKGKGKKNKPALPALSVAETDDQQRLRFQVELEFIQCLANPNYIHFIAQRGYLKDPKFINYLKYLMYWKEPEYARYIKYPLCLYFLDMLQYEHFRREVVSSQCVKFIDDQAVLLWQHYTRRRIQLQSSFNPSSENQAATSHSMNPNEDSNQALSNASDANGPSTSELSNGHLEQNGSSSPLHESNDLKRKFARIS